MRHVTWPLLAACLPALLGLSSTPAAASERLQAVVSVLPLQWLVEQVGGEAVQAHTLVGPGRSPHTYEPTPRQLAELAGARLYLRVGMPFEQTLMERVEAVSPGISILDLREGLRLRSMESVGRVLGGPPSAEHPADHDETAHEGLDPHVWTSPVNLIQMAERVRDGLSALDPEHARLYRDRYAVLAAELAALDRDLAARLARAGARAFMVFHPSWGYFAEAYGLEQIPLEHEGKAPGPRTLAALVERARRDGVRKIFVQQQFDQRAALTLAAAIGAEVVALDPLAYDVPAGLRALADEIAEGP